MPINYFSSQYLPIAHGALNWDTALRNDMTSLQSTINTVVGQGAAFAYNATCVDFGGGWASSIRNGGNQVTFNLGVNPGANNFSSGSGNNLIGTIPAGSGNYLFRPASNVMMDVFLRNSDGSYGGKGSVAIFANGTVVIQALGTAGSSVVANGGALFGCAAWPAQ